MSGGNNNNNKITYRNFEEYKVELAIYKTLKSATYMNANLC
jgi:hypothetical protein